MLKVPLFVSHDQGETDPGAARNLVVTVAAGRGLSARIETDLS
jgi:hypothetical protein